MGKAEATVEELVGRIERGQLRLPEMQRRYVWRSPRLLDGQQRLTSLSAVIRGEPVNVRGRKKPLELLFNLEHPEQLTNGDGGQRRDQ